MSKKIIGLVFCTIIILWCWRIYRINQTQTNEYIIPMLDTYYGKSISITPVESYLLDKEDFLIQFPVDEELLNMVGERESKFICVCVQVTNTSQQNITWDWVMEVTSCGFETKTWGSTNITYIGNKINVFDKESLEIGQSQKIWYVTVVNPICFKDATWKRLKCEDFRYVLALGEEKISIQLE